MSKSSAVLLAAITLVVGFLGGVLYSSYSNPVTAEVPELSMAPPPKTDEAEMRGSVEKEIAQMEAKVEDPLQRDILAGNLWFDHEFFEEALERYERAIEKDGENPDVLTDAGVCKRQLNDPKGAVEYFRRARKADPKHENSALNLGIVLFHDLQDRQGAVEAWREYLALDPKGERAEMIRRVLLQMEKDM